MAVLGILNERPMYTYEFKQIIEERGFEHWAGIQLRSIYKAMDSLTTKGYLICTKKIQPNTSFVKTYEVNDAGRKHLRALVEKAFYNNVGLIDFWLAISFMHATTRKFAIKALADKKVYLLKERDDDKCWIDKIDNGEMFIPTNYQGLIKMGYEISFITEKRIDEWVMNLENGSEKGFFVDEREGNVCDE